MALESDSTSRNDIMVLISHCVGVSKKPARLYTRYILLEKVIVLYFPLMFYTEPVAKGQNCHFLAGKNLRVLTVDGRRYHTKKCSEHESSPETASKIANLFVPLLPAL